MLPLLMLPLALALAATPETQQVTSSLGDIAYWEAGQGETVVLVHGLPTAKDLWTGVFADLSRDHHVIALDLPNFGESARLDARIDHPTRAAAIEELRLGLGIDDFTLVAHDLGASVAVDYMDRFGEHVSRLVLMSPPVYPDFEEPGAVKLVRSGLLGPILVRLAPRTLYRKAMHNGLVHDEQLTREMVRDFARVYYRGGRGKRALRDNLWWGTPEESFAEYQAVFRSLEVPALVIQGGQDPFIPVEHAYRVEADIPDARLVLVGDAAHFVPLDTPERVAEEIRAFVSE